MCQSKACPAWKIWVVCGVVVAVSGCRTTSHAQSGALIGTGIGSFVGAVVGGESGHAAGGAVAGALTGAVIGGLAGDAEDAREERDAAVAQAKYQQYIAAQQAVTNSDLITMTQAGLSDQVIVNAVQTRGGQFDLSPNGIIDLKNQGVSDHVILSIQSSSSRPVATTYAYPTTTIVAPPSAVYVVPPRPTVGVGFMVGRPYGYRGCYGRPPRHFHHW